MNDEASTHYNAIIDQMTLGGHIIKQGLQLEMGITQLNNSSSKVKDNNVMIQNKKNVM